MIQQSLEVPLFKRIVLDPRFLVVYSLSLTTALALVACLYILRPVEGASNAMEFDRLRVHRIDIVEPDGTPRLILSDKSEYPGSFFHGREIERSDRRDSAGMLFINDEGTEDGGLIYGGVRTGGKPSSFSHLSFDQYEQDQTVVLGTEWSQDGAAAGMTLNDAPAQPITPEMYTEAARIKAMPHGPARQSAWATFMKTYPSLHERAALARSEDGSVGLALRDKQGRVRLQLNVDNHGEPSIHLLDATGKVKRSISLATSNH